MKGTINDYHDDEELESQTLSRSPSSDSNSSNKRRHYDDRKPSGDDPISDWLLKTYYTLQQPSMSAVRYGIFAAPLILILFFYFFVSSSTSNTIAFVAMVISLVFIGVSMWILCWILDKD
jgi:hypothetical protein